MLSVHMITAICPHQAIVTFVWGFALLNARSNLLMQFLCYIIRSRLHTADCCVQIFGTLRGKSGFGNHYRLQSVSVAYCISQCCVFTACTVSVRCVAVSAEVHRQCEMCGCIS